MSERSSRMGMAGGTLAVLAKAPIPGLAKTRLIPRLGADGAALFQELMILRTLRMAASADFPGVALWCTPGRTHPFFQDLRGRDRVTLLDQPEGSLGDRMLHAFEVHLSSGGPVVLIGTDCPALSAEHLQAMRLALQTGVDAVFVPAEDGGYVAIGLRRADPSLFKSVRWGTSEVMQETRMRLRNLGWLYREFPAMRDVDVPADLDWLMSDGMLSVEELGRLREAGR